MALVVLAILMGLRWRFCVASGPDEECMDFPETKKIEWHERMHCINAECANGCLSVSKWDCMCTPAYMFWCVRVVVVCIIGFETTRHV